MNHNPRFGDEQFIELFDVDLVTLPSNLPSWFIEQRNMLVINRILNFYTKFILFFKIIFQGRRKSFIKFN